MKKSDITKIEEKIAEIRSNVVEISDWVEYATESIQETTVLLNTLKEK